MRRLTTALMILFMLASWAMAEIPCTCGMDACQCFIQLGDEGMPVEAIQDALVSQGFLAPNDDASTFDEKTLQAVLKFQETHHLPLTGMMDDKTLTLLLWGVLPEVLDVLDPHSSSLVVWVPTDGGKRHHDLPTCSGMHDPRLVTQRNALAMEMLHCGRCKPFGHQKK